MIEATHLAKEPVGKRVAVDMGTDGETRAWPYAAEKIGRPVGDEDDTVEPFGCGLAGDDGARGALGERVSTGQQQGEGEHGTRDASFGRKTAWMPEPPGGFKARWKRRLDG